ncbi:MAG: prolyl oligopeptidase family serine peptidase [Cyclobacteriaceae bacterium]
MGDSNSLNEITKIQIPTTMNISRIKSILSIITVIVIIISCSSREQTKPITDLKEKVPAMEALHRISYTSVQDNQERDYYLYTPKGYGDNPDKKWPILMFLHGDGERGNGKEDLGFVLAHGPLYEAWVLKRDLPFIIISPQLQMFGRDAHRPYLQNRDINNYPVRLTDSIPPRKITGRQKAPMAGAEKVEQVEFGVVSLTDGWEQVENDLVDIIDNTLKNYAADESRVYLTGLSYGGFGTWYMGSKHPELFAAISPVVGWGHPEMMQPIADANLPVWVFAGGRDGVVEVKNFYLGVNKLEALGHTPLRFTTHEDLGHDTWIRVYGGQDIYDWFLEQRKK